MTPVLILRASLDGVIPGVGVSDAHGCSYRFPAIGESFEWAGPELVGIVDGRLLPNDLAESDGTVRHLHVEGIGGYAWGISSEPEFADQCRNWRRQGMNDWLVLACDPKDVAYDKGRSGVGKCRVKRGVVAYLGDLAGALDCLRAHWPDEYGKAPSWEESPLFPPPDPTAEIVERHRVRDEQYDKVMAQRGGQRNVS